MALAKKYHPTDKSYWLSHFTEDIYMARYFTTSTAIKEFKQSFNCCRKDITITLSNDTVDEK